MTEEQQQQRSVETSSEQITNPEAQTDQTGVPSSPPEKKSLTKRKYFIPSLLGILLLFILGSWYLSYSAKKSEELARIPTPTPTPFQTYTGLKATPLPVYGSYLLERKVGIYTDKILTFAPTQYYSDDHQITRYKDYLYYIEETPTNKEPYPKKLIQLSITTGEKKVVFDSKTFDATAKGKFGKDPYSYQIPFQIIDTTLFFSIVTEGKANSSVNLGPSATYTYDLISTTEAQKNAEIGGYYYHAKGRYWINTFSTTCATCPIIRTYNLLNPGTKSITPLSFDGNVIAITNDEMLIHVLKNNSYPPIPPSVKRIPLTSPTTSDEVIPSSQMPSDITDIGLSESRNLLFLVGPKAFYTFNREKKELTKLVDVNEWEGDKIPSNSLQEKISTAHIADSEGYFSIGGDIKKTQVCYRLNFADKKVTRINYTEAKCNENVKTNNINQTDQLLPTDDTGTMYKTLEEKIKSLKLPKEYIFRGM